VGRIGNLKTTQTTLGFKTKMCFKQKQFQQTQPFKKTKFSTTTRLFFQNFCTNPTVQKFKFFQHFNKNFFNRLGLFR